jgi:hypothetical protein
MNAELKVADPYFHSMVFAVVALIMWLVGSSLHSIFTVALFFLCEFLIEVVVEILPHHKMTRVLNTPWTVSNQRNSIRDICAFVECMRCYDVFLIKLSENTNAVYEFHYPKKNPTNKLTLNSEGKLSFNGKFIPDNCLYIVRRFNHEAFQDYLNFIDIYELKHFRDVDNLVEDL